MRLRFPFAIAGFLAAAVPAFGQQDRGSTEAEQPKPKGVYRPVEEITFLPTEIYGETAKAPGLYVLTHGDAEFPSFIDERANFKKDLAKSIRLSAKVVQTTTAK